MGLSLNDALEGWPYDLRADQILALTPIVEAARLFDNGIEVVSIERAFSGWWINERVNGPGRYRVVKL